MKDIPGYEGLYFADEHGNIYSNHGKNKSFRCLNPTSKKWYVNIRLCKNKIQKAYKVHTLIAITFIPNPSGLPVKR